MLTGVVSLVVKTPPAMTVADFCRDVDIRIRELLHHQRFPVRTLESRTSGGPRLEANRVAINFMPLRLTLDFGGAEATASYTNHGPVGHFGLFFLGSGDELALSTAGIGRAVREHRCRRSWSAAAAHHRGDGGRSGSTAVIAGLARRR